MGTEPALTKSLNDLSLFGPNLKVLEQNPQIVELQTIIRDKYDCEEVPVNICWNPVRNYLHIEQKYNEERF